MVFCLPSIQAGGGAYFILISQRKSGIPPNPPSAFPCSNGTGTEAGGQKFLPPTPFLFARLLGGVYPADSFAVVRDPKTFRRADGGTTKQFDSNLFDELLFVLGLLSYSFLCLSKDRKEYLQSWRDQQFLQTMDCLAFLPIH